MTIDLADEAVPVEVRGTTTFTSRALQRLASGIASDTARVSVRDVSVNLADERGALRVSVTVPVAITGASGATIVERGEELRRGVIDGMKELAGRSVGMVDVRYAGVRRITEKRVR
jgi:hypothetical protein